MLKIGNFFQRVQGTFVKEIAIRSMASDIIKKNTGLELPMESIIIKNGVIDMKNIRGAAKSAIFVKKTKILQEINDSQSFRKIVDIR